ncbi:hypothetical protein Ahy_B03g063538 isoform B [Arachis hypogaea]|uniref:Uncharacterized protein n=1 Tax=Arachis hypogaea TaxID=3818 RepID=A0A444ZXF5_ARAHY|nr:hypothetical protein Ahy_B03g063538 isoform B [Arachis hypogaea]
MNSDNEEDFEANYKVGDENEDGEFVMGKWFHLQPVNLWMSHLLYICSLDLDAIHARKFLEYVNIGVDEPENGEFRIEIKYSSRKLLVAAIWSYTISRGVDYTMYKSESQMFYAKYKTYGSGCNWLIQASLIEKKDCWEIRRYNGRHTCTMGTISQDYSKLDSDMVAKTIRPLLEIDPSLKVKSTIAEV